MFIEEIYIAKACGGGLLFLSNISLISIGFSVWSIGGVTAGEAQISVTVDDLIDINQYFEFGGSPKFFDYTSDGIANDYVVDASAETQEGYIEIPFQINVKSGKIADHLAEGAASLRIKTVLVDKNENLDFFSFCTIAEAKLASSSTGSFAEADFKYASPSNSSASKELTSTFDLSQFDYLSATKAFFSVRYKVTFVTSDFKSAYSSAGGSFRFSFKAGGVFDE